MDWKSYIELWLEYNKKICKISNLKFWQWTTVLGKQNKKGGQYNWNDHKKPDLISTKDMFGVIFYSQWAGSSW